MVYAYDALTKKCDPLTYGRKYSRSTLSNALIVYSALFIMYFALLCFCTVYCVLFSVCVALLLCSLPCCSVFCFVVLYFVSLFCILPCCSVFCFVVLYFVFLFCILPCCSVFCLVVVSYLKVCHLSIALSSFVRDATRNALNLVAATK